MSRRLRIILAVVAVSVLALGGWYIFRLVSLFNGTLGVDCDKATRFLRAVELPEGTYDRQCTMGQGTSIFYELDFRAPRESAEAWLVTAYPHTKLSRGYCGDVDACAQPKLSPVPFTDRSGHRLADAVFIDVTYEDGWIAHVQVSGWTM